MGLPAATAPLYSNKGHLLLHPPNVTIHRPGRALAALAALIALIAVMLPASPAAASTTFVTGNVVDGDGDPVEATVQLDDAGLTSDSLNGQFMFPDAPTGSDTLVITADGYQTLSESVYIEDDPVGYDLGVFTLEADGTGDDPDPVDVTGFVEDATTGDPIEGADVALADAGISSFQPSSSAGMFLLIDAPVGTDTLTIDADGYEPFSQQVDIGDDGGTYDLGTFELAPEPSADPTNFEVEPGDQELHASWDTPAGDFDHYELSWTAQGSDDWDDVALDDDVTEHTIDGLDNDVDYEVRIRTINDDGSVNTWVSSGWVTPEKADTVEAPFRIIDDVTTDEIEGAEVTLGGETLVTGPNGQTDPFTVDAEVAHDFTVVADGYETLEESQSWPADHGGQSVTYRMDPASPEMGEIVGEVTDGDTGDPIEGADVEVDGTTVTTNADGLYEVGDLQTAATYTVNVDADGYQPDSSSVPVEDTDTVHADFELDPEPSGPTAIEGTVADADTGDPIEGATVTFSGGGSNAVFTTGDDGTFRNVGIDATSHTVTAEADGYEDASETVEVNENETATVDLDLEPDGTAEGATVTVTVDNADGMPAGGVTVELGDDTDVTDDSGQIVFEDVADGDHDLDVGLFGHEDYQSTVTVDDGQDKAVNVELVGIPAEFEAFVNDEDGRLADATVTLNGDELTPVDDGEYVEELPAGDYELVADADGYEPETRTFTSIWGGNNIHSMVLEPSLGDPANLEAEAGDGQVDLTWDPADNADGHWLDVYVHDTDEHVTDASLDGDADSHTVGDLDNGTEYRFEITGYIAETAESDTISATATPEAPVVPDPEPEDGEIVGEVTDADSGDPLEGAEVTLSGDADMTASTDGDGTYGFGALEPGDYTVTANADGFEPAEGTAEIVDGDTVTVDLTLDAELTTGSLHGDVTDADTGEAIEDVRVSFGESSATSTDDEGYYRTGGIDVGTYTLTFEADGYETVTVEDVDIAAGEFTRVDVVLDAVEADDPDDADEPDPTPELEVGTVAGTVTDTDGEPVGGATVTINGSDTTTGADGSYEIDELDAGTYDVTVVADGYAHGTADADVSAGDTTTVDVVLDAVEMSLACNVHDEAVAPGDHVECVVSGLPAGQQGSVTVTLNPTLLHEEFEADADGTFEFAFDVPDDATDDDEIVIAVETSDAEADATFTLDIVEPDVTTADGDTTDTDDGEQLPRTGLDLLLLVLMAVATMAAGGTALRVTIRA